MENITSNLFSFYRNSLGKYNVYEFMISCMFLLYSKKKGYLESIKPEDGVNPDHIKRDNDDFFSELQYCNSVQIFQDNDFKELINQIQIIPQDDFLNSYPNIIKDLIQWHCASAGKEFDNREPEELCEVMKDIVSFLKPSKIYDPFAGLCSYAFLDNNAEFLGEELNQEKYFLGRLWLDAHGKDYHCLSSTNSLQYPIWTGNDSDTLITNPPYGMRVKYNGYNGPSTSRIEAFVLNAFKWSPSLCKAIIILPSNICFTHDSQTEQARRELLPSLQMVITLPTNIFSGTSISTNILVFDKYKNSDHVHFVNASEMYTEISRHRKLDVNKILNAIHCSSDSAESFKVSKDEILENDNNWRYEFYLDANKTKVPEGYIVKTLGEILTPAKITRHFTAKEGLSITPSILSKDTLDPEIQMKDLESAPLFKNAVILEEPALLVSNINKLNPTFCHTSGDQPVFINSGSIKAYKVLDKDIHIGYLAMQIANTTVFGTGALIPRISEKQFMKIKIAFPPLDGGLNYSEQKNIFSTFANEGKLAQAKELGLKDVIDSMKAEYINEVRMRKHDMRPYMRALSSSERLMRYYLEHEKNESLVNVMSKQLDYVHDAITNLSDLLEHLSEEEEFGKEEKFDLNRYLHHLQETHSPSEGYTIRIDLDIPSLQNSELYPDVIEVNQSNKSMIPLTTEICPRDFARMVTNILENARKHGFTDKNRTDYTIEIWISANQEKGVFQIDFKNNGNPLPQGMTKERFGLLGEKAGITGGTGRGGNIIKKIARHFRGDYDVFSQDDKTVIRVELPIVKDNHE